MLLLFVLVIFVLFYIYLRNRYNYWKERGVHNVKPILFFGNIKEFVFGTRHLGHIYDDIYKSFPYDKLVGVYDIFQPNLMIKDTNLINEILIKDFNYFQNRNGQPPPNYDPLSQHIANLQGAKWKTTRSKLTPAFSSAKLKMMYSLVSDCTDNLNAYLSASADECEPIDVKEVMARFTTNVIGSCAFGLDFNTLNDPDSEYRKVGKRIFATTPGNILRIFMLLICPKMIGLLKIKATSQSIENFFFGLMQKVMKYETDKPVVGSTNFLQLMLNIRNQETVNLENKDSEVIFNDTAIASNMFIFYAAGFETTASTLSYCLYELALNADVQEKLRDEIKSVRDSHDEVLNYDALNELVYMDMVIAEVLRKWSPVSLLMRICTETYQIPGTSLIVKPGDRITIPVYSIHHDENYYPNPDKFDPERFTEENKVKRPPNTYYPFGDGPRMCIGLRFAKLEMKCCLASMLTKYRFELCNKTEIPIKLNNRSFLYAPKNEVWLSISKI